MRRNFHNSQRQDASALNLGNEWNEGWKNCVFDIVWKAYDRLKAYYKSKNVEPKDEIEDDITFALLRNADIVKNFYPANFRKVKIYNQPPDKSKERNRKRNTNDIGVFFGDEIEKSEFIFESKKISTLTVNGIGSYKEDLDAYLEEYYGSHLAESSLIAYLHKGTTVEFFALVEKVIKRKLKQFSLFPSRPHKTSEHKKTVANAKNPKFLCHHLIFEMQ
ncbi:MAG TPA: hypothetical protein PKE69_08950 [Pyrinomonadaceae bacterium]|nr:hypothetical protein [Pyrinomonadaceae bacterium]